MDGPHVQFPRFYFIRDYYPAPNMPTQRVCDGRTARPHLRFIRTHRQGAKGWGVLWSTYSSETGSRKSPKVFKLLTANEADPALPCGKGRTTVGMTTSAGLGERVQRLRWM